MKIYDLEKMISQYGDLTLSELISKLKGDKLYTCPKCNGKGTISVKYNAYPSGLPDSGFVDDWRYKDIDCDLCKGFGYTEKQYKPKMIMIQDGWE